MDAERIDDLSRSLARQPGRRRWLVWSSDALLAVAGLRTTRAQDNDLDDPAGTTTGAQADGATGLGADGICRMRFQSTVRLGPTLESNDAPVIAGLLSFQVGDESVISEETAEFEMDDGTSYPLTGQGTGRSFLLRITMGEETLVAIGAGEETVRACKGEYGGSTTGPRPGDLGDWIATA